MVIGEKKSVGATLSFWAHDYGIILSGKGLVIAKYTLYVNRPSLYKMGLAHRLLRDLPPQTDYLLDGSSHTGGNGSGFFSPTLVKINTAGCDVRRGDRSGSYRVLSTP